MERKSKGKVFTFVVKSGAVQSSLLKVLHTQLYVFSLHKGHN